MPLFHVKPLSLKKEEIMVSRETYLPIQNCPNICPNRSSDENSPVILLKDF